MRRFDPSDLQERERWHDQREQRRRQRRRWAMIAGILVVIAGISLVTLSPLIERAWLLFTGLVPSR